MIVWKRPNYRLMVVRDWEWEKAGQQRDGKEFGRMMTNYSTPGL